MRYTSYCVNMYIERTKYLLVVIDNNYTYYAP